MAKKKVSKAKEPVEVDAPKKESAIITDSVKKVKVKVYKNHHCKIGGCFVKLSAGETTSLPTDVAAILSNSGVVSKI